jgi:hypothetical protein
MALHNRFVSPPIPSGSARVAARRLVATTRAAFAGALAAGLALLPVASNATVAPATPAAVVGETTLVIGQSRIIGADGSARDIQRGTELRVGDRIETRPGAHVHVRFVDGGRVSVRPASRLVVEQYAPADAAASGAIKFRLEEGVVRSITGAWGEAARERFRLNTPVAAIGVKGTDFVVRASDDSTAASVFAGSIVVSPLTPACAGSLGPCASGAEKLLSADMKGQMLEFHRDQPAPRLVPAVDLMALAMARNGSAAAEARPASAPAQARVAVGSTEIRVAVAPAADTRSAASAASAAPGLAGVGSGSGAIEVRIEIAPVRAERPLVSETVRIELVGDKPVVSENLAVATLAAANSAAIQAAATAAQVAAQVAAQAAAAAAQAAAELLARRNAPEQDLFWLRWPWAAELAGDDFSKRFDAALLLGTRSIVTDGGFSLRRPEGTVFAPQDASASFRLTGAAARVLRDGGYRAENVQITEGSLAVDFARATFASSLTAVGPVLGSALVQAAGTVDAAGGMRSTAGNALMVGGFNGDGHKAGLSFSRDVPGGVLQGISQWNR